MKSTSYIKGALLQVCIVAIILVFTSCGNNQKPKDSKDFAEESNEAKFDNKLTDDAQFLVNAAVINLKQIQLGKLAQQKGSTSNVQELGKIMEDAYTKLQSNLSALARSKSISIPTTPTDDTMDAYTDLNEKSGNDFDKAYADMMVNKQKDAIDTYLKASTESYDKDLKNWAIATLPELRTQLSHAIDCKKKCEEI